MTSQRRINVASGREFERLAHYSRAVRVGDTVFQSGTTAIDRQGEVVAEGDVAGQVDAIMRIAAWSLDKAGSRLADVVRARIYLTDIALTDAAARAVARHIGAGRPTSTLVQVSGLMKPTQLVEIELDAVDGAASSARRIGSGRAIEEQYAYSRALRVGDRVYLSGSTALTPDGAVDGPGDMYRQTRRTLDTVFEALDRAGGRPGDIVYTKSFLTDLRGAADYTRAWLEAFGDVRPTSTLLGIPALVRPEMLVEIEAEAIVGAERSRRDVYTEQMREKPRGYARAVEVGDQVFVSGCTALDAAGRLRAEGDWAAQYDLAVDTIQWALARCGTGLDDVVRRRTFTVAGAEVNRPFGQGPAWFARSCPASLGCRISGLARPGLLVEVEVAAIKGAGANIEWLGPDPVDPLEPRPA